MAKLTTVYCCILTYLKINKECTISITQIRMHTLYDIVLRYTQWYRAYCHVSATCPIPNACIALWYFTFINLNHFHITFMFFHKLLCRTVPSARLGRSGMRQRVGRLNISKWLMSVRISNSNGVAETDLACSIMLWLRLSHWAKITRMSAARIDE